MFNSIAATFGAVAAFFGGMFGIHHGTTTPLMPRGEMHGTTTPMHEGRFGTSTPGWNGTSTPRGGMGNGMPVVRGTVSAISGTTLTLSSREGFATSSPTKTFTVDATNAVVLKATDNNRPATSTLSSVAVGDTVAAIGTLNGTTITAKTIIDGKFMMPMSENHQQGKGQGSQDENMPQENNGMNKQ